MVTKGIRGRASAPRADADGVSVPRTAAPDGAAGLVGHSNPGMTVRYSHLYSDPLCEAAERVGAIVSGKKIAEVGPMRQKGA
jgi:hypothetical protein